MASKTHLEVVCNGNNSGFWGVFYLLRSGVTADLLLGMSNSTNDMIQEEWIQMKASSLLRLPGMTPSLVTKLKDFQVWLNCRSQTLSSCSCDSSQSEA